MREILAEIDAPPRGTDQGFNCAIVLWDDIVKVAAPIVGYMATERWHRDRVRSYCAQRGWRVSVIHVIERPAAGPPPSIVCPKCGRRSYHPKDIENRYCGVCGFHDAPR